MATETNLNELNINILTTSQFNSATKDSKSFYFVTDDILPISAGGTGANTAAGVLANIGAAPSGYIDSSYSCTTDSAFDAFLISQFTDATFPNGTAKYIGVAGANGQTVLGYGLWRVELFKYTSQHGYIIANSYGFNGTSCRNIRRSFLYGSLSPWEWENPPMNVGVEYPTTERYDEKTVYCKRIDCGTLPAGTIKSVAHGLGASTMVRCYGRINSGSTLPSFDGTKHIMVFADASSVYVYCTRTDLITVKAYVTVYYTKS